MDANPHALPLSLSLIYFFLKPKYLYLYLYVILLLSCLPHGFHLTLSVASSLLFLPHFPSLFLLLLLLLLLLLGGEGGGVCEGRRGEFLN